MMKLNNKKAQSALEYLMTYGWALVVMVVVIAALVALNVFNLGAVSETCGGFSSQLAYNTHFYKTNGNLVISFVNGTGRDVNVTALTVDGDTNTFDVPQRVVSGETFVINALGFKVGQSGATYKVPVVLTYDYTTISGFTGLKASGTCLGKYQ